MDASWADCKSKKPSFWSVIFSYSTQPPISWLDCDLWRKVDVIQQLAVTSSMAGQRRCSKALPKAKLAPEKDQSHCLVASCLSDPLQLLESQRNHDIWEVCWANRWDAQKIAMPAASTGQKTGPNSSPWQHPTARHTIHATKFCLIHHIHLTACRPAATFSSISTTFWRENASTTSRTQKRVPTVSKAWTFTLQE